MRSYRPPVELDPQCTTSSQSEIGRPVALGIFILCGEISILSVSVFVPELSELCKYVWIDHDPGVASHRPQMTVHNVLYRADERPAIKKNGRAR